LRLTIAKEAHAQFDEAARSMLDIPAVLLEWKGASAPF
jgi:hypothetical protein